MFGGRVNALSQMSSQFIEGYKHNGSDYQTPCVDENISCMFLYDVSRCMYAYIQCMFFLVVEVLHFSSEETGKRTSSGSDQCELVTYI